MNSAKRPNRIAFENKYSSNKRRFHSLPIWLTLINRAIINSHKSSLSQSVGHYRRLRTRRVVIRKYRRDNPREGIIRCCRQASDARNVAGEIVLYIINTVIKLASMRARCVLRREGEKEKKEIDKGSARAGHAGKMRRRKSRYVSLDMFLSSVKLSRGFMCLFISPLAQYTPCSGIYRWRSTYK